MTDFTLTPISFTYAVSQNISQTPGPINLPYIRGFFSGTPESGFKEILSFETSAGTSFPGLVMHNDKLQFSYYSSHEEKSAI